MLTWPVCIERENLALERSEIERKSEMEFEGEPERLWDFEELGWEERAGEGDAEREGKDECGITCGDENELERNGVLVGVSWLAEDVERV